MNGCCCSLVKYLLILINFVFWTAGIVAFILIGWALTDPSIATQLTQHENYSYIGLCVLIGVATLILIIAFLGCCGALKESQCMLGTFFCFLVVILVAEIATGVYAYQYRDKLQALAGFHIKETVQKDYNVSDTKTAIFDVFQSQLYCCGADGPLDWKNSKFSNKSGVNLDLSNREAVFKVPRSCCRNTTTLQKCDEFRLNVGTTQLDNSTANVIHTNGCTKTLLKLLNDNLIYILAVLAGIVGVEIIALLIALCLCCAVGDRDDHYKS